MPSPAPSKIVKMIQSLEPAMFVKYGPKPIPDSLDDLIINLVQAFMKSGPKTRSAVIREIRRKHSDILLAFAERMASLAVRHKDRKILIEGLVAIALEDFRVDPRQDFLVLSLFDDAAGKIYVDSVVLFDDVSALAEPKAAEFLRQFVRRNSENKSIASMGYEATRDSDGFRYRRTW